MVVDTSAVVAVLLREPDALRFARCLGDASARYMSAVTRVELSFVLEGRTGDRGRAEIEQFWRTADIEIAAVTPQQADLAIEAFCRFGKGRHPAALNIGDCFAYALAKTMDMPLLFKGADFARTDIRAALTPPPPI